MRHLPITPEQQAWLNDHGYQAPPDRRRIKVRLYDHAKAGAKGGRNGRSARAAARARWDRVKKPNNGTGSTFQSASHGQMQSPQIMAPNPKQSFPAAESEAGKGAAPGTIAQPLRTNAKHKSDPRSLSARGLRICEFCGCPPSQCPNIPACDYEQ